CEQRLLVRSWVFAVKAQVQSVVMDFCSQGVGAKCCECLKCIGKFLLLAVKVAFGVMGHLLSMGHFLSKG
ncbi:hypothetical protein U1Q18_014891, partial [Sarracenia purpurea var. burkii]